MAAQNFADALQALVAHRDTLFLARIAEDYKLDLEELKVKYTETCSGAFKVPKKRQAKVTKVAEAGAAPTGAKCCATTAKKEQCKFSCLSGEVFCKRHLKQALGGADVDAAAKPVKKAAKKGAQPVHTHVLTDVPDGDCELCQSHGNPLAEAEEFELAEEEAPKPKTTTLADRLASLMADTDDEDEYASDSEAPVSTKIVTMEEEFEDEE
jgi:hypothetical protein